MTTWLYCNHSLSFSSSLLFSLANIIFFLHEAWSHSVMITVLPIDCKMQKFNLQNLHLVQNNVICYLSINTILETLRAWLQSALVKTNWIQSLRFKSWKQGMKGVPVHLAELRLQGREGRGGGILISDDAKISSEFSTDITICIPSIPHDYKNII